MNECVECAGAVAGLSLAIRRVDSVPNPSATVLVRIGDTSTEARAGTCVLGLRFEEVIQVKH